MLLLEHLLDLRERPGKINVYPYAPSRTRGRPKKITNNDFDVEAPTRGRWRTCEPITASTIDRRRNCDIVAATGGNMERLAATPTSSYARERGIGIGRAATTSIRGRGIGIGKGRVWQHL